MLRKGKKISRRNFLGLFGVALIGFFILIRFIYSPTKRLQAKLYGLGFEVEEGELDKFWAAYIDYSKARITHPFRILRTYLIEPRAQNIVLFLLSSNALVKKADDSVRFISLYSAYNRPCFHPFLDKG